MGTRGRTETSFPGNASSLRPAIVATAIGALLLAGCMPGMIRSAGEEGAVPPPDPSAPSADGTGQRAQELEPDHVPYAGARRLTPDEYDRAVAQLLGAVVAPSRDLLPLDVPSDDYAYYPFDANYEAQVVSAAMVEGVESLAELHADALVADSSRRSAVVGCTPQGPADEDCRNAFLDRFGRLAFRRPLTPDERSALVSVFVCPEGTPPDPGPEADWSDRVGTQASCGFAVEAGDFFEGVRLAVRAVLMSPAFLQQMIVGTPVEDDPKTTRSNFGSTATRSRPALPSCCGAHRPMRRYSVWPTP